MRKVLCCVQGEEVILQLREEETILRQVRVPLAEMSERHVLELRAWSPEKTEAGQEQDV